MKLKEILEMPRSREYVFHTDLSIGEYVATLNNPIVKRNYWGLDSHDVSITVKDDKFIIEKSGYGRDNQCFWGLLHRSEKGTDISGHFGLGWFSKINPFFIIILVLLIFKLVEYDAVDKSILRFIESTLDATQIRSLPKPPAPKIPEKDELDENHLFYSGRYPPHTL